jgi:hypothetical protein
LIWETVGGIHGAAREPETREDDAGHDAVLGTVSGAGAHGIPRSALRSVPATHDVSLAGSVCRSPSSDATTPVD